jgi:hypothetical protein
MIPQYKSVDAVGLSGTRYKFEVYPLGTEFRAIPGLYIFSTPDAQGGWDAAYVGHSHDLQSRVGAGLANHHCYLAALNAGVTHIGVCPFQGRESDRTAAEADLIAALTPRLNRTNPLRGLSGGRS